ncbi:MAG: glycerate kinase [Tidjanibacter sp.]|nr:glycerate kinase [Tidjanibacter sp.]
MKILIATDSFKGSLTSQQAGEALARGICGVVPECEVEVIPIADGGEGTAEVLTRALGGEIVECEVSDPLGRTITAQYGIAGDVALIDFASSAGLTLLQPEERNPLKTTSWGVGKMILDALHRGAHHIVLGLGGSATNECGVGMLQALGCRFLDSEGREVVGCGGNLHRIATIDHTNLDKQLEGVDITLVVDVLSPLCGEGGATHTFAPQKGATPEQVAMLEEGVYHFAHLLSEIWGGDITQLAGAGAAGGAGGGIVALAGARLRRGIDVVLEAVEFARRVQDADLVITGEGRVDAQTLLGKAPSGVLAVAKDAGVRVVAVGGSVAMTPELAESDFAEILAATPEGMPLQEALKRDVAQDNLQRAGERIAQRWLANGK